MKRVVKIWLVVLLLATARDGRTQGYIVPNGVTFSGFQSGIGYSIDVIHDPTNGYATGFALNPIGKTPPTVYTNTFQFDPIVDVGVRTFLVSSNTAISIQPILAQSWTELTFNQSGYVFTNNVPFYLALYTGTGNFHPPDNIYSDPLFGWVELVNNQGVIQMLGGAIEYGGDGIYAGTLNIIQPVPEPTTLGLLGLGGAVLAWQRRKLM